MTRKALFSLAALVVSCGGGDFIRFSQTDFDAGGGSILSEAHPGGSGGKAAVLISRSGSGGKLSAENGGAGGGRIPPPAGAGGVVVGSGGASSTDGSLPIDADGGSPEAATGGPSGSGGASDDAGGVECEPKLEPTPCPRCNVVTGGCCTAAGRCGCYHQPYICS